MGDRRVHATVGNAQIVRYDRAGKWYYEGDIRRQLSIAEAVQFVSDPKQVRFNVPGGGTFDRLVRAKFAEAERV